MHVLREPIQRHLTAETLGFSRGIDLGAYGLKLRAQADIVDEAGYLSVALAPFDPTTQKIRERRQRLPIDSARDRMVPELEILTFELRQLRRAGVILRQLSMQHEWHTATQRFVVEFVPLHAAEVDALCRGPFTQKRCPGVCRGNNDIDFPNRLLVGIYRSDFHTDEFTGLTGELLSILPRWAEYFNFLHTSRLADRHNL